MNFEAWAITLVRQVEKTKVYFESRRFLNQEEIALLRDITDLLEEWNEDVNKQKESSNDGY